LPVSGGLALANAGLGAVHGFAGVIGGRTGHAHGAICGRLLPRVLAINEAAVREADPAHPVLPRFGEVRGWIAAALEVTPVEAYDALGREVDALGLPGLGAGGLAAEAVPEVVRLSQRASSMQGNPVKLSESQLAAILTAAL